jgi:7-cyano-7-deazaguanine synthase
LEPQITDSPGPPARPVSAVLISGGLDSAVLLADEARRGRVQPIYVAVGLAWEAAERATLNRFISQARASSDVLDLVTLSLDMSDVYPPSHWAMQGSPPAYHTPDEAVYLHGRNIVLLVKAGVFCAAAGIERLVIGTLDHNPFPDATTDFRRALESALSLGLARPVVIDAPFARTDKAEVIRRGAALHVPMNLTLSCMNPVADSGAALPSHCGICSKCRERHDAFVAAGVTDPTRYASRLYVDAPDTDRS